MEPVIHEPINIPSIKYMDSSDDEDVVLKRPTIKTRLLDSDEEISEKTPGVADEEKTGDVEERTNEKLITKRGNLKRILTELGSDSDEDEGGSNDLTKLNDSSSLSNGVLNDEKDDLSIELNRTSSVTAPAEVSSEYKRNSLFSQSDLYDAEDSDDDAHPASPAELEDSPTTRSEHTTEEKSKKRKPKEKKIPKAKSSKGELQKIHSESQRMIRESRVALPYHRPRQRTLAEFLNRREHTVLPVKSLKSSPTKLGAVWKTLEKKVTEAEQFYKSDSDSGPDEEEQSNEQGNEQDIKQDDDGENELGKKEEAPAAVDSVTISQKADSVCDDPKEEVMAEVGKALLSVESSDEKFPGSITPSVCDLGEKVTDVPVEGIKSIDEAVFVSGEVSDVLSNSENAKLNEERGDQKEESDSRVNNVDCSHDTELACDASSTLNSVCDITVAKCENIPKCDDDHLHSQFEKPTLSTVSNTDFSNLFLKTGMQKKDGTSQVNNCGSETLTDRCEGGLSTGNEKLHIQENAECCKIKIPSPPPMEDSESISLRLDDDTVDETGPKLGYSHDSTLQGSPMDADNPEPQTRDEADPPRMSTPVRMLMELDDANDKDSAEEAEAEQPGHHKTFPLPTAGLHPSTISPIRLKGDPDNVIDLDEDVRTNPRKEVGVRDLMQRFIRHHIPKKVVCEEKKVDIGIEVVEGGGDKGPEKVKREVMSVTLGGGDPIKNVSPGTERPGARLRSLREELQREIARKRDEEWAKRQREYSLDEEEGGEEGKCNLDDEEEEELTESSSSEEEEEEEVEENDVDMSTKSRPRSEYVDDEAEESDEEEEDLGAVDNEDSNEESLTEDKEVDQDEEEEEALVLENDLKNEEPIERKEISSDVKVESSVRDEGDGSKFDTPAASGKKRKFQRFKTFDLFDSEDDNDDVSDHNSASELLSPPLTPFTKDKSGSKGRLSLPSPALPLTALQRYTNSPVDGQSWDYTQKQLSDDDDNESPKQTKDENDPLKGKSALINLVGQSQESVVAEDELLNLMSGAFLSRVEKMSDAEDDFSLTLEDTQEVFDKLKTKKVKEERVDDDKSTQRGLKNFMNSSWSKLNFDDNDKNDEKEVALDDDMETIIKRKKLKRLDISDDEDDNQNALGDEAKIPKGGEEDVDEEESDSESGGEEEGEESELDEEEDEAEKIVEYDSEENAIVVERKTVKKARGARRGLEFLEAEAELSEGEEEWAGSGDEDEHGLDRMEKEEGDADKLDDEIVRRELGRIHMRQVLDEDKREVRLFQEIFLEDGELHADGQGRERRFRWKNVDNMDDGDLRPMDSGDEEKVEDEDENEEKWRRLRHEREMWLREHKENGKIEDSESLLNEFEEDSQLLKLGRAALRRTNSFPNNALTKWLKPAAESKDSESTNKIPEKEEPESPDVKRRFQMLCKRGSFLARKDGTLERLAEMAIKSGGGLETECLTSSSPVVAKTKNSRKFVFTVLSPEKKKDLKASVEASKAVSSPVKKNAKRKRRDPKQADGAAKKSKLGKEASIFQFL